MLCLPSNLLAFPASGGKGTPSPLECPLSTHLCSYVCVELFWVLLGAQSRASPTPVLFQDTYNPWPHSSGPAHYITDWLKRGKWVGFGIEVEKVSQIQGSFSPQSLEFLYFFHSLSWHFIPLCLYHVFNGIAEEISIWKAYLWLSWFSPSCPMHNLLDFTRKWTVLYLDYSRKCPFKMCFGQINSFWRVSWF